ncbi:MAG: hypothetical protein ACFFEJ_18450 [Candidatus Thorarchaeota archaeon]
MLAEKISAGYERLTSLPASVSSLSQGTIVICDTKERRIVLTKTDLYIELEIEISVPDPLFQESPEVWHDGRLVVEKVSEIIRILHYIIGLAKTGFTFELLHPDLMIIARYLLRKKPTHQLLQAVDCSCSSESDTFVS